jgi:glycosyltransferase involved in cell wall biosynthesis
LIVTAGGLEHGGGIGRVIGYMIGGWSAPDAPRWRVVDTRGPRVDLAAPFRFLAALATIAAATPRGPLLHMHIAGRGSTVRKLIVGWLARALRLRLVLHLHDYNYRAFCDSLPGWALALVRGLFRGADLVVVLGRGDAELVQARFGVAPERIAVMHNAVPAPVPPVAPRTGSPVHILFLGRLSERKGVPELIAALAEPALAALPWRATVAGDGDVARYRAAAERAGVGARIDFPGWLDRAATDRLLRAADILVLPSYDEGMAMSVLEGLAHAMCVVCTPVGALAEVIEHDVNGMLVQPGDVAGLAAALAEMIANPSRRLRLALGGEITFRRGFEVQAYARRMLELYRRAVADAQRKDAQRKR